MDEMMNTATGELQERQNICVKLNFVNVFLTNLFCGLLKVATQGNIGEFGQSRWVH